MYGGELAKLPFNFVQKTDSQIAKLIELERQRSMNGLELIPSENFASLAVLQTLSSYPCNKYSEGYPAKRYYGGNEIIDQIEQLAIDRAKKLFGAQHANVQPLSGAPANFCMFLALMEPNDKFMAMRLDMGGHLSHGHKVHVSGKFWQPVHYGVDQKTELLDYDVIKKQAEQEKPKMLLSGYTAYPRKIDFKAFREIADSVGAYCVADIAHIAGLCAAGVHENPVPYFDAVTTTTHKTLRGPRGAMIFCKSELAEKIDKAVFPGFQGGPHQHVHAAIAVALKEAMQASFKKYAWQIVKNAKALADGLMAGGLRLVSGGTDNHLMLVDLQNLGLTGLQAETALNEAGITVNKNAIPYDPRKPWDPSGIRLGTPAITSRGMKECEMKEIAKLIVRVLKNVNDASEKKRVRREVLQLCKDFMIYS